MAGKISYKLKFYSVAVYVFPKLTHTQTNTHTHTHTKSFNVVMLLLWSVWDLIYT